MRNLCIVSLLELGLFVYTIHRTGCEIIGEVSGNGNPAALFRMLILTMTSFCRYQVPSISFDYLNNFPDFQEDTSGTCICPGGFSSFWSIHRIGRYNGRLEIPFNHVNDREPVLLHHAPVHRPRDRKQRPALL